MQEKTLKLEISHTTSGGKVRYGILELPASELEIEDSLQQARTNAEHQEFDELVVYHCKPLHGLLGKRLDSPTIKELNFFAKRLALLNEDEKPVLQAVVLKYLEGKDENQLVSIKDLMGKFAIWRLKSHETFGGTWLSDYVPNRLGGFIEGEPNQRAKPDCPLIGQDGNIFNLAGIASRTLKRNGMADEAAEMTGRVFSSKNYDDALNIIGEYVNITSPGQDEGEEMCLRQ